jgi:hypothetical protein
MSAICPIILVPYIPFYRYWIVPIECMTNMTVSSVTNICSCHKICSINSPADSRLGFSTIFTARNYLFFFSLMGWDWVHLVLRLLFCLLYQPQMADDDDCGAIGGMRIGRGNRSTRRKPAPVLLCPPQIPYDLTRARTRAAAVGRNDLDNTQHWHEFSLDESPWNHLEYFCPCTYSCDVEWALNLQSGNQN